MVCYQGSERSTSEGIERIFDYAEKLAKVSEETNSQANTGQVRKAIPVVVFDEIGLAELSPSNPLKVLHSRLEFENVRVGFIGISNWHLDSSKMNRVLTVARRDPDEAELQETATVLQTQIMTENTKNEPSGNRLQSLPFTHLAKAYSKLKPPLRNGPSDFSLLNERKFGLRDFYHLVKFVAFKLYSNRAFANSTETQFKNQTLKLIRIGLQRNFGFDPDCFKFMWTSICQSMDVLPDSVGSLCPPSELLSSNLEDPKSRFLLIQTDHAEVHEAVYSLLRNLDHEKAFRVMIGSPFPEDADSEAYCYDVISEVTANMEQDRVLVLHNLEEIYTSLYDLFNQNFREEGKNRYCRIVQAATSNQFFQQFPVHPNFRLVLFMTAKQLQNAEEPLINRFEKYVLTRDDLQVAEKSTTANAIINMMKSIFKSKDGWLSRARQVIPNLDESVVSSWVTKIDAIRESLSKKPDEDNNNPIFESLHTHLQRICSLDLLFALMKTSDQKEFRVNSFLDFKRESLVTHIRSLLEAEKSTCTLVHTFTSSFNKFVDNCDNCPEIRGLLNTANPILTELNIQSFKSHRDLMNPLKHFFEGPSTILVVRVVARTEHSHLYYLQNLLADLQDEHRQQRKHIIITVHHKPETMSSTPLFPVSEKWDTVFIDNLYSGLSDEIRDIILNPQLSSAIEFGLSLTKLNFDAQIDKCFADQTVSRPGKDVLKFIQNYFSNFHPKIWGTNRQSHFGHSQIIHNRRQVTSSIGHCL